MTRGYRLLIKTARTVHIYTTLAGLLLVLLFAVTGFMLNHEDWFGLGEASRSMSAGHLSIALLEEPDKLGVVEHLRQQWGATGAVHAFDIEEDSCKVVFKSPGRVCEVIIDRRTGNTEITHESRGLAGRLTDLHRGKESGPVWGLVIDGTCLLLLVVASTGLILWYSLRTRFHLGLVALSVGGAFFAIIYAVAVP